VRLGTSLTAIPGNTTIQFTGALSHGLGILGADAGASGAQIDFTKVSAEAAIEQPLGPRIVGRLHGIGQYSDNALPAVELIGAGGGVIGRAFDTGLLTGDSGIGGFCELAYRPVASGDFAMSEAYLFGDAGRIHANPRLGFPGQSFSLASAGAGLRAKYKDRVQLGVEAAAVLQEPYPAYDEDYRVNVYYSVTF
jgi:hemolysin activation/secretion protein